MKPARLLSCIAACAAFASFTAGARIVEKNVDYTYNGTTMKGFVAYDDAKTGARPGILVVHEWWGLNDYVRFGGSTVLALAYSGEPLRGVVTFHGGLFVPDEAQRTQIRSPILILHGEEDAFIKPETIAELKKVLDQNKVDWFMVTYAHAVHAFTNPDADSFKIPGIGYNEKAAKRSWDEMQRFFAEQLGRG